MVEQVSSEQLKSGEGGAFAFSHMLPKKSVEKISKNITTQCENKNFFKESEKS